MADETAAETTTELLLSVGYRQDETALIESWPTLLQRKIEALEQDGLTSLNTFLRNRPDGSPLPSGARFGSAADAVTWFEVKAFSRGFEQGTFETLPVSLQRRIERLSSTEKIQLLSYLADRGSFDRSLATAEEVEGWLRDNAFHLWSLDPTWIDQWKHARWAERALPLPAHFSKSEVRYSQGTSVAGTGTHMHCSLPLELAGIPRNRRSRSAPCRLFAVSLPSTPQEAYKLLNPEAAEASPVANDAEAPTPRPSLQ